MPIINLGGECSSFTRYAVERHAPVSGFCGASVERSSSRPASIPITDPRTQ